MLFKRPSGAPQFNADWYLWFFERLTLPEGTPTKVEGHVRLIAREGLAPNLRELLVLMPKGNWKTTITAAAMCWHLLTTPNPNGYVGAADRLQADEMFRFMVHFIQSEPELAERLLVRQSTREVRVNADQGFARVLASDDSKYGGKRQGLNATFFDLDELHAHSNENLYVDARSGLFKRNGRLWTISTAGYDPLSVLGRLRANFLKVHLEGGSLESGLRVLPDGTVEKHPEGRLTIARTADGRSVALMWECLKTDARDDDVATKWANPASTVTIESLRDARLAPGISPWAYDRYRRNLWTLGFESWIPEAAWPALKSDDVPVLTSRTWDDATVTGEVDDDGLPVLTDEFAAHVAALYPEGTSVVGAADMARYRDTAALVLIARREDGRKVPRAIVWRSGGRDKPIRYEWVKAAIRAVHRLYDLRACGADDKYFDQSGEELTDEGVAMESFSQATERIAPADTELRKEILSGEFAHDGDPILAAHIAAGKALDVGTNLFKIITQNGASPPPIDACRAFSMANAIEKWDTDSEPLGAWG